MPRRCRWREVGHRVYTEYIRDFHDAAQWEAGLEGEAFVCDEEKGLVAHMKCPMPPASHDDEAKTEQQPGDTFEVGSVLGISYQADDSFYWHTDKSIEGGYGDGWLLSVSFGETAVFEYKSPTMRDGSATCYTLQVEHGDGLLINAGILQHRVKEVLRGSSDEFAAMPGSDVEAPTRRLNLQIRRHHQDPKQTYLALAHAPP